MTATAKYLFDEDFAGGGKPTIFGTITVSDGISMGTPGMRYSLVSREVIAAMPDANAIAPAPCSSRATVSAITASRSCLSR